VYLFVRYATHVETLGRVCPRNTKQPIPNSSGCGFLKQSLSTTDGEGAVMKAKQDLDRIHAMWGMEEQ
jgi:hypothetical protein